MRTSRLLWLLFPLAAALALGLTLWQRSQVPSREDWQRAVGAARALIKPGDGLTWAPYYAGEGRLFFHELPAFHTPDLSQADFARYDRVFLLGAFGHDARELPPGHQVEASERFGPLTLERIQVGGPKVVGDLYANLESVKVTREGRGAVEACDFWDGQGWYCGLSQSPDETRACLASPITKRLSDFKRRRNATCGLDPFLHVSRDVRAIGHAPRRCVFAHPIAGKKVVLEWAGAPPAEELVVDYGFTDQVLTDNTLPAPRTKPARLMVERGGAVGAAQVLTPEPGWRRFTLAMGGRTGPLRLILETESTVDAHLCLDPTLRVNRRAP